MQKVSFVLCSAGLWELGKGFSTSLGLIVRVDNMLASEDKIQRKASLAWRYVVEAFLISCILYTGYWPYLK